MATPAESKPSKFRPYHTGLRKQIDFEPVHPGQVLIYNCGPTVYGTPHIGNYRSFLFADLLRRYLEWRTDENGKRWNVTQVMNITDVGHLTNDDLADAEGEDKLLAKARELGWSAKQVAEHYEREFFRDLDRLGVRRAHHYPRATDHIADMLAMIQQLIDKGHAYITSSGEVYYHVPSFPEYGKLSGKDLEQNIAGARVEVRDEKRDPRDFALWKVDDAHLMQWDPRDDELWAAYTKATNQSRPTIDERIKKGFPGWHIECSAMSKRLLGPTIDIHTGGEDNIFPHHECEIAQSVAANQKPFVSVWMHARHLLVNNKKMSKREGTLYTLDDLMEKGYSPAEVRWALISQHYRQPMNFTLEGLDAARASLGRLRALRERLGTSLARSNTGLTEVPQATAKLRLRIQASLDDDLNASNAIAALFEFVAEANRMMDSGDAGASDLMSALESVDQVLGIIELGAGVSGLITKEQAETAEPKDAESLLQCMDRGFATSVQHLVIARFQAKAARDFALADRIRDALKAAGVTIEDTREGVRYRLPAG